MSGAARHAVRLSGPADFDGWRDAARRLLTNAVAPERVVWLVGGEDDLFAGAHMLPPPAAGAAPTVPRAFPERAAAALCHRDPERFALLYRLLWRLSREPGLLDIASDADVARLARLEKAVRRDGHKMRAFVRFRRLAEGDPPRHVAWFEPDHHIVERNAPFFVRRFTGMRWTILTPDASADWDGTRLTIGPGARREDAPCEDAAEALWRTYFTSIFNPARLKVKAMQAEMPKKYWRNLPEARLIPEMIRGAGRASDRMIEAMPSAPPAHHHSLQRRLWAAPADAAGRPSGSGEPGADATTLDALAHAAADCRRCPLWRDATQAVFGEGPGDARLVFVGEQPGDQEDIAGKPFVGPAGRLFDSVLEEAGIERRSVYVTNAVKHFKFTPRGKRRIHQKPNAGEVRACRWWLDKELGLVRPRLAVALGATAIQGLLGKALPVTRMRGRTVQRDDGLAVFLTIHPSYVLRLRDEAEKAAERARFLDDLRAVRAAAAA